MVGTVIVYPLLISQGYLVQASDVDDHPGLSVLPHNEDWKRERHLCHGVGKLLVAKQGWDSVFHNCSVPGV